MEQFLYSFIHIGIPFLVLLGVLFHRPSSKIGQLCTTFFYVSILWFLYLWGQWPIAVSLYFKYFVLGIIIASLIVGIRNYKSKKRFFTKGIPRNVKNTLLVLVASLFSILVFYLYLGREYKHTAVTLEFPLKNGRYYIGSGGSNKVINNHYGSPITSQHYALDINKIGDFGRVSKIGNGDNESHYIFGEPIYCPCDGTVIASVKSVEDNAGASMNVDPENGSGNFVDLRCDDFSVFMAHLMHNSVKVDAGQKVSKGDFLARVGNSGFSQEPHLHFQVSRLKADSSSVGIPMQFKGRTLVRNDVFEN